jgi:hypothetical protein
MKKLFTWAHSLFHTSQTGKRVRPAGPPARQTFKPGLEGLEDRLTPSGFFPGHGLGAASMGQSHAPSAAVAATVNASPVVRTQANQPFSGFTVSEAKNTIIGDCFDDVEYTVAGKASVLGFFTGVGHQRVSYCGEVDLEGEVTLTDQSGDQLTLSYVGVRQGDLSSSSYLVSATITGGTGAFKGVTGSAILTIADYSLDRPFDAVIDGTLLLGTNNGVRQALAPRQSSTTAPTAAMAAPGAATTGGSVDPGLPPTPPGVPSALEPGELGGPGR